MVPIFLPLIVAALTAAVLSIALYRNGVWMHPPNERSSHTSPTSRAGGLAIIGGGAVGILLLLLLEPDVLPSAPFGFGILLAFALVLVMALIDDMTGLGVAAKLAAQVAASAVVADTWTPPDVGGETAAAALAVTAFLWLLATMNAVNFMDGIDGLAGGQAVVAGAALAVIGWQTGAPAVAALGALLSASVGGFLAFNLPPARIFMGDTGSQMIGLSLGVLGLMLAAEPILALVVPVLLFSFLWDVGLTLLRRAFQRRPLFNHRDHLHQLMHMSGASHGDICRRYALFAVMQAFAAMSLVVGDGLFRFAPLPLLVVAQIAHTVDVLRQRPVSGDPVENADGVA